MQQRTVTDGCIANFLTHNYCLRVCPRSRIAEFKGIHVGKGLDHIVKLPFGKSIPFLLPPSFFFFFKSNYFPTLTNSTAKC